MSLIAHEPNSSSDALICEARARRIEGFYSLFFLYYVQRFYIAKAGKHLSQMFPKQFKDLFKLLIANQDIVLKTRLRNQRPNPIPSENPPPSPPFIPP